MLLSWYLAAKPSAVCKCKSAERNARQNKNKPSMATKVNMPKV